MGSRVVILGAGESGVGAALLANKQAYDIFVSDNGSIDDTYKEELNVNKIAWEENKHTKENILNANLVIKSPGIHQDVGIVQEIRKRKIIVLSEIEFASQFTSSKLIAVTGSNGKTTTSMMIYQILKNANLSVDLVGNIGKSFSRVVSCSEYDYYVLEVSSFQLEDIEKFSPKIAVITNITPDHLERYEGSFEKYANTKMALVKFQTLADYLIFNLEDETLNRLIKSIKIKSKCIPFSTKEHLKNGICLSNTTIKSNINTMYQISTHKLSLKGKHNIKNAMAAIAVADILKIKSSTIRESLTSFYEIPHRLEFVRSHKKISFVNDSKATNVNASLYALESIKKPIIWLAGGIDKGNDYEHLYAIVREKVKAIVCIGVDNQKIINSFSNIVPYIVEVQDMKEIVSHTFSIAHKKDIILLSPACASFDLYENYEDRGNKFKMCVNNLK